MKNYQWQLILKKQKINVSYKNSLKYLLIRRVYAPLHPGGMGAYIKLLHLKDEVKQPLGKLFINNAIIAKVGAIPFYFVILIGSLFLIDKVP